jgi:hypothetical protein
MMSETEIMTIVVGLHVGGTEGIRSSHQYLVALQYLICDLPDVSQNKRLLQQTNSCRRPFTKAMVM